jgi:hypothetical protein
MVDNFRSGEKRVVHTRINTTFDKWREMVLVEYAKLDVNPATVTQLRELHAWEGGDTTQGWATHVWHNNKLRERSKEIRMLNPEKK